MLLFRRKKSERLSARSSSIHSRTKLPCDPGYTRELIRLPWTCFASTEMSGKTSGRETIDFTSSLVAAQLLEKIITAEQE